MRRGTTVLVRNVVLLAFLLAIPSVLLVRYGFDAVIPLVAYLQFILLWAQTELWLRQNMIHLSQFEPFFDVRLTDPKLKIDLNLGGSTGGLPERLHDGIYIRNVSKNPAYAVGVARILDERRRPIRPGEWVGISVEPPRALLPPREWRKICSLSPKGVEFLRGKAVEIGYVDKFHNWKTLTVVIREDLNIMLIPEYRGTPGILLNMLEFFYLLLFVQPRLKRMLRQAEQRAGRKPYSK